MAEPAEQERVVSITPLLKRIWPSPAKENVTTDEIALAISHIFTNSLTPVQTGALLTALHFTGLDRQPDVLSKCAQAMRNASSQIDKKALREVVSKRGRKEGGYKGGLVWSFRHFSIWSSLIDSSVVRHRGYGRRFAQHIQY
jgi:anthranilate phosphoribosyltransferase